MRRKHAALQDIRDIVEQKLAQMLARNPLRMDYYKKYQEIIADYNREKDRATIEETFAQLVELANSLDEEQQRAAEEGLSEDELALFDLLFKENISKADRERLKQASKGLLASLRGLLRRCPSGRRTRTTQAEVQGLHPRRPVRVAASPAVHGRGDRGHRQSRVYDYVWQRSASGA